MKLNNAIAIGATVAGLAACTTTYITPVSVADTRRVDITENQEIPAGEKVFTLPNDWQWGPWVMRGGAKITFREDGTGNFECRVYAQYNTTPEELHFQSIQYAKDGNRLFSFPGKAVGYVMAIRTPYTDYPYNASFGFDERHFEHIDSVKFYARTRLKEEHVGHFAAKRSSFTSETSFDPTGSPPEVLPPTP